MKSITTRHLTPNSGGIAAAANILSAGGLVAFATETVYGLGADARNDRAVAAIFAAKSRPSFNPLIVHVADVKTARIYVQWCDIAARLADAFWPGPLTLVLPIAADCGLSPLVTAQLPSLAIRIPARPSARKLLAQFGGPVAAPSANPSGKISPTTAAHVAAGLSGRIDAILDDGACDVGVESTILDLTGVDGNGLGKTGRGKTDAPVLLRPGGLPQETIEACLGMAITVHTPDTENGAAHITAPGQLASHYAPNAPVRLNAAEKRPGEMLLGFGETLDADLNLSPSGDLIEAAANLFRYLHDIDTSTAPIAISPIPNTGLGRAINDRLKRAAAPRPT